MTPGGILTAHGRPYSIYKSPFLPGDFAPLLLRNSTGSPCPHWNDTGTQVTISAVMIPLSRPVALKVTGVPYWKSQM